MMSGKHKKIAGGGNEFSSTMKAKVLQYICGPTKCRSLQTACEKPKKKETTLKKEERPTRAVNLCCNNFLSFLN